MNERPAVPSSLVTLAAAIVVVAIFVAAVFLATQVTPPLNASTETVDTVATATSNLDQTEDLLVRITINGLQAQVCIADHTKCVGGFVRVVDSGKLLRIAECGTGCRFDEINVENLAASVSEPSLLGQYQYILLPGNTGWEFVARQYAQQRLTIRSTMERIPRCRLPDCSPIFPA